MMKRYDAVNKSQSARMSPEAAVHGTLHLPGKQARQDAIQREKSASTKAMIAEKISNHCRIGVDGRSIPSRCHALLLRRLRNDEVLQRELL